MAASPRSQESILLALLPGRTQLPPNLRLGPQLHNKTYSLPSALPLSDFCSRLLTIEIFAISFWTSQAHFAAWFGYPKQTPTRAMEHITVFKLPCHEQSGSSLFSYFPGEVRDRIFAFALSCHENPKKLWDKDTPYVRPGYNAAQVADVALLQTCQRVYIESMPS